jgi:predicted nucleic acid-binding protein
MVVDTNIIISILLEPTASSNDFALNNTLNAPTLLKVELINVLRKYHFFSNLNKARALNLYQEGIDLISEFYSVELLLPQAIEYSFLLNHPIYDCIYLSLAQLLNDPFVSKDKKLLVKAKSLGINIIEFNF